MMKDNRLTYKRGKGCFEILKWILSPKREGEADMRVCRFFIKQ